MAEQRFSLKQPSTPFQRHQARKSKRPANPSVRSSTKINNVHSRYNLDNKAVVFRDVALPGLSSPSHPLSLELPLQLTHRDFKNANRNQFGSSPLTDQLAQAHQSETIPPRSTTTSTLPRAQQHESLGCGRNDCFENNNHSSAFSNGVRPSYGKRASYGHSVGPKSVNLPPGEHAKADSLHGATFVPPSSSEFQAQHQWPSYPAHPLATPSTLVAGPKCWNCSPVPWYECEHPLRGHFLNFVYGAFSLQPHTRLEVVSDLGSRAAGITTKNRIVSYVEALYDIGDLGRSFRNPVDELIDLLKQYSWEIREYHVRTKFWKEDILPSWFQLDLPETVGYHRIGIIQDLDGMDGFGSLSLELSQKVMVLLAFPHCIAFSWTFDEGWMELRDIPDYGNFARAWPLHMSKSLPSRSSMSPSSILEPTETVVKQSAIDWSQVHYPCFEVTSARLSDPAFPTVTKFARYNKLEEARDKISLYCLPFPSPGESTIMQELAATSWYNIPTKPQFPSHLDQRKEYHQSYNYTRNTRLSDTCNLPYQLVNCSAEGNDFPNTNRQAKFQGHFLFKHWKLAAGRRKLWACTVFMKLVKQVKVKNESFVGKSRRYGRFLPATRHVPAYLIRQEFVGTRPWRNSCRNRESDGKTKRSVRPANEELDFALYYNDPTERQRGPKSARNKKFTTCTLQRLKSTPQSLPCLLSLNPSFSGGNCATDEVFVRLETFCGIVLAGKYRLHKMITTTFHFSVYEVSKLVGHPNVIEARRFSFIGLTRKDREDRFKSLHKQRSKSTYFDTVDELGSFWIISRTPNGKTVEQPKPSSLSLSNNTCLQRGTVEFERIFPCLNNCCHTKPKTEVPSYNSSKLSLVPTSDDYVTYANKVRGGLSSVVSESRELDCVQEIRKPKSERQKRRRQRHRLKKQEAMRANTSIGL